MQTQYATRDSEAPDALFDCSSAHLAVTFGARTRQMMRDGRDPYIAARLAFTFAARVIQERPKVIGHISPSEPWGVS